MIDVPFSAFIPESYIGDLNLRLALYQRMAAATEPDAHIDLERELNDRFGPPPAPVKNLLFVVRLRGLAKRAGIASVQREDGAGGRPILSLRTADSRDLRAQIGPRAQRDLEKTGAVTLGHTQLRIDLDAAGEGWRDVLLEALEAAAGAAVASHCPAHGPAGLWIRLHLPGRYILSTERSSRRSGPMTMIYLRRPSTAASPSHAEGWCGTGSRRLYRAPWSRTWTTGAPRTWASSACRSTARRTTGRAPLRARRDPRRVDALRAGRGVAGLDRRRARRADPRRVSMADVGDVDVRTVDLLQNFEIITEAARLSRRNCRVPVFVGGDHAITFPIVRAFDDSAADARPVRRAPGLHGREVRRTVLARQPHAALERTAAHARDNANVGLRGRAGARRSRGTRHARRRDHRTGRAVVREGVPAALAGVPGGGRAYVTIDIDVLDPSGAPGTGYPEPGGINYYQLKEALRLVAARYDVVGFDVTEVDPVYDAAGVTSRIAGSRDRCSTFSARSSAVSRTAISAIASPGSLTSSLAWTVSRTCGKRQLAEAAASAWPSRMRSASSRFALDELLLRGVQRRGALGGAEEDVEAAPLRIELASSFWSSRRTVRMTLAATRGVVFSRAVERGDELLVEEISTARRSSSTVDRPACQPSTNSSSSHSVSAVRRPMRRAPHC